MIKCIYVITVQSSVFWNF